MATLHTMPTLSSTANKHMLIAGSNDGDVDTIRGFGIQVAAYQFVGDHWDLTRDGGVLKASISQARRFGEVHMWRTLTQKPKTENKKPKTKTKNKKPTTWNKPLTFVVGNYEFTDSDGGGELTGGAYVYVSANCVEFVSGRISIKGKDNQQWDGTPGKIVWP